jgi:hypothetical protein
MPAITSCSTVKLGFQATLLVLPLSCCSFLSDNLAIGVKLVEKGQAAQKSRGL